MKNEDIDIGDYLFYKCGNSIFCDKIIKITRISDEFYTKKFYHTDIYYLNNKENIRSDYFVSSSLMYKDCYKINKKDLEIIRLLYEK